MPPDAVSAAPARTVTDGLTSISDGNCRQRIEQENGKRRDETLDFLQAPAVSSPLLLSPPPTSHLRTPHSALRTSHSALPTPHSALRTPHSALRTPHPALR
ncbi:MAG: hypothetical protein ACKO2P_09235, partial [Planctomycetota bacterium]